MQIIKKTESLKTVQANRHFHILVDVSGSMYSDLNQLKTDLQNSLASVNINDRISIIYYSSKGDCGFILKNYQHTGMDSLSTMQKAVDMLSARNLTGFVDPLNLCANNLSTDCDNVVVFMSDGYENQSPVKEVLAATKNLASKIVGGMVVEYGGYANHTLLAEMADNLGTFKYAHDFKSFDIAIREVIGNSFSKKILIETSKHDFAFSITAMGVVSYPYDEQHDGYLVGEDDVVYLVNQGDNLTGVETNVVFALMYLAQLRNNSSFVYDLLKFLSFVEIIDTYQAAIGKEKVNNFLQYVLSFAMGSESTDNLTYNEKYLPDNNAYTLFDLLEELGKTGNLVYTRHNGFKYQRIGAKKVPTTSVLTNEDRVALAQCVSVSEVNDILSTKYEISYEYKNDDKGNPLNLTYNSNRGNISFTVNHQIRVDLTDIPDYAGQIKKFDSFIFRSYTIVKDMILNVRSLPFQLTRESFEELQARNVIDSGVIYDSNEIYIIQLDRVPMINRNMLNSVNFNEYVDLNVKSTEIGFSQKVINTLFKEKFPEGKGNDFTDLYGAEYTAFLKSIGITEFNGFNPPVTALAGSDMYYAPTVKVSIKGFSSIPTLKDVITKQESGKKLTPSESVLFDAYTKINGYIALMSDPTKDDYITLQENI